MRKKVGSILHTKRNQHIFLVSFTLIALSASIFILFFIQDEKNSTSIHDTSSDKTINEINDDIIEINKLEDKQKEDKLLLKSYSKIRKNKLNSLVDQDPGKALEHILSQFDRNRLGGITNTYVEKKITVKGKIIVSIADRIDGTYKTEYFIQQKNGVKPIQLALYNPSNVEGFENQLVTVKGFKINNVILTAVYSKDEINPLQEQASVTYNEQRHAEDDVVGPQSVAVLPVYFPTQSEPSISTSEINDLVLNDVSDIYVESSYGEVDAFQGTTQNWTQLPSGFDTKCYLYETANRALTANDSNLDYSNFNRIVIVAPLQKQCGFAGVAYLSSGFSSPTITVSASVLLVDSAYLDPYGVDILVHELGHNFGMRHSHSMHCGENRDEALTLKNQQCARYEYDNPASPMGNYFQGGINFSAPERDHARWIESSMTRVTASGTYTLKPISSLADGTKTLRIRRGVYAPYVDTWLYIEYRDGQGYDANLPNALKNTVLLHTADQIGYSTAIVDPSLRDQDNYNRGFTAGMSLTDPETATTIDIADISNGEATIDIDIGKTNFSAPYAIGYWENSDYDPASGTVNFIVNAGDDEEVKEVRLYMDSIDTEPYAIDKTEPYNFQINTTEFSDGRHTVYAIAEDKSGDPYSAPNNISYPDNTSFIIENDASPPEVTLTSPSNNSTISNTFSIEASATDNANVDNVKFYLDDIHIATDTTSPYSASIDSTRYVNGPHEVYAVATDSAGQSTKSTTNAINIINSDAELPTATLSIDGRNGGHFYTTSVIYGIRVSGADNNYLDKLELYLDDDIYQSSNGDSFITSINTQDISDGRHTMFAKATDNTGNTSISASITFTSGPDTTPPTVSFKSPTEGSILKNVINFEVDVSDDREVKSVDYYSDGTLIGFSSEAPFSDSMNSRVNSFYKKNGQHTFTAVATDTANNTAETSISVVLNNDYEPPKNLRIINPLNGADLTGIESTFTADVTDNQGIEKVEFYKPQFPLNEYSPMRTDRTRPYTYTINTFKSRPPATYLTLKALDYDANYMIDPQITYTFFVKQHYSSTLARTSLLQSNQFLESKNKRYALLLKKDGSLKIVKDRHRTIWQDTFNMEPGSSLRLEKNGKLVLYNASRNVLWSTKTGGAGTPSYLSIGNDGQARIFSQGRVTWTSKNGLRTNYMTKETLSQGQTIFSNNRKHRLVLHSDGNLKLHSNGKVKWMSGTSAAGRGTKLKVFKSGVIALFDKNNRKIWSAGKQGPNGKSIQLVLTENGVIKLVKDGKLVWARQ